MQLHLKKILALKSRASSTSAQWIVQEAPGIVLMKNQYNRELSPLAPPDGWAFQGRWGEKYTDDRLWLRRSGLYTQVFPTRREALQALAALIELSHPEDQTSESN